MEDKVVTNLKPTKLSNKNKQTDKIKNEVNPNGQDVVVKKRRMEVELLDISQIKSEPRKRRAVQRLVDTQEPVRMKNKKLGSHFKEDTIVSTQDLTCTICDIKFETSRSLKTHQNNKHKRPTQFTCTLCSQTFDSNINLLKHKLIHKAEERTFLCMKCKSAFTDHLQFLKHQANHKTNKQSHFCIECRKEFDVKSTYLTHIATHHDVIVKCDICEADIRQAGMKFHLLMKHTEKNKLKCVECDKMYTPKHMIYHMYMHTGVTPFQCLYCGKGFKNRKQVEVHTSMHTDERPYNCDLCPYKGRQQVDVQRHRLSHFIRKNIECKLCGRKYRRQKFLNDHMDIHNNTQKYVCTICGLKLHTSTNLKSHFERVHNKDQKYECVVCNTSFNTRSDLTKHTNRSTKHKNNLYGYEKKLRQNTEKNNR